MTVQDVSDSCDALPACRSTQSVHTDSRPFRFFNLPAGTKSLLTSTDSTIMLTMSGRTAQQRLRSGRQWDFT
jgi:hypothetical protein